MIPGVKVTATATATDLSKTVVTGEGGNYTIDNLIPGRYDINAELAGSKTIRFQANDVRLEVSQVARVDFAEQLSTRMVGTVWDQSGDMIPGVEVTATATATDLSKTVVTGEGGNYTIDNLIPGRYDINAELAGSKTLRFEAHDVLLEEGQVARVDFAKQPSNLE